MYANGNISNIFEVIICPYAVGPSGGLIFYDKGVVSDGWRFLEASPTDLMWTDNGMIVGGNGYYGSYGYFSFGCYRIPENGNINLYVNGTTSYLKADCTNIDVEAGKRNTQLLVDAMGSTAYYNNTSITDTFDSYAARVCDLLEYSVNGELFDDWYLPSILELSLIYERLKKNGLGGLSNDYYWSSSEAPVGSYGEYAYRYRFQYGDYLSTKRYESGKVRPVRSF